ncbi:hypothetical protein L3Y34_009448 [Caenorhabditis briggsae]|uniref:DUF38 domain-containing protein n=1 Tax=Caenorhabditis briggsae TaxID=6238 RepID=A0AAE9A5C6_CAEBR|nr:hypothetical protein L3Y34_009448 [Caenorhabditis briggsae]
MPPSLLQMPDVVLSTIFKKVDLYTMLTKEMVRTFYRNYESFSKDAIQHYKYNQKEVVTLVSNIDSKLLESIEMSCARSVKMEMDEIVRLEHWKNLKQVEMSNLVTDLPLHYFSGMARVSICRIFVSGEDVALLKEMFTQYPSMIKFHIHAECVNKPQYERILGKSQVGRSVYGGRLDKWLCEIGDDTVQFALFGSMDNWYFSVERISKELF